ncbi:MAG TPA: SRPBCC family protein, partial [Streptosporangiaceae bacterium]
MELEHSFTVPVSKERAWDVLLDVERVAPCMPGATLDSVDGDAITGKIKVKVGPISMTYAGTAKFVERDKNAGVVTLEASGKETRGSGTASASVRSVLEDRGTETHVTVHTTLNVTGKPAQFGRGVMNEVSGKLIGIFATNLADMITNSEGGG